jgi:hypothetical protein
MDPIASDKRNALPHQWPKVNKWCINQARREREGLGCQKTQSIISDRMRRGWDYGEGGQAAGRVVVRRRRRIGEIAKGFGKDRLGARVILGRERTRARDSAH